MISKSANRSIEVEAKFLGGEREFEEIVGWLVGQGFSVERRDPVHRIHIYFDDADKLRRRGCRLRCVIAAGEWCRYDFKAVDPPRPGETLEISEKTEGPIPIREAIVSLANSLPEGEPKAHLLNMGDSARVVLVMMGWHRKAAARRGDLALEVSWDILTPLEAGLPLSEIEIELESGSRRAFDVCISNIEKDLDLCRSDVSKLERGLGHIRDRL